LLYFINGADLKQVRVSPAWRCKYTGSPSGEFDVENSQAIQHVIDEIGKLWFMLNDVGL
jgi:hypothetical protein